MAVVETQPVPERVKASPTKEFFISMLVRDVPLTRAILDLVDNSLDGARRVGGGLSRHWVEVTVSPNEFSIRDNCGGIEIDVARDYAFRFGRPDDASDLAGAVGLFGVGMKRTIFKLGNYFSVKSATTSSRFSISQDVAEWLRKKDDWNFDFELAERGAQVPDSEVGTSLVVTSLHEEIALSFSTESFITELKGALEDAHATSLAAGFVMRLNGMPLVATQFSLLSSDKIVPARTEFAIPVADQGIVTVTLVAGITSDSERNFRKGGWYVFCNGRQVVGADQSPMTGWGLAEDGESHARYHADFAFFRGYAFFDSDNARLLPWTTTKTGVDVDSRVLRVARRQMVKLMRPVTRFLRELADDKSELDEAGEPEGIGLEDVMNEAKPTLYSEVKTDQSFSAPPKRKRVKREVVSIQYSRPREDVEKAKQRLGVGSATQVGEQTFSYFLKAECE